jgi:hypothetical protein
VFDIEHWPDDDPQWLLDGPDHPLVGLWGGATEAFWGQPIIDGAALDTGVLDRYAELQGRSDLETVAVLLYPSAGDRQHDEGGADTGS